MKWNVRRAPQHIFDKFKGADEETMGNLRQEAIDWLEMQPIERGTIYVIPDPETGEEMELVHPGLQ